MAELNSDETDRSAQPTDAEIRARKEEVIRRFWSVGLRVEEHSLVTDREALLRLAQGHVTISRQGIRLPVVNDEALESLAVRLRPLLLTQDGLHYDAVLGALRFLAPDMRDSTDVVKAHWRRADIKSSKAHSFSLYVPEHEWTADTRLVNAWVYGEVVHATATEADLVASHPREAVQGAASFIVANLAAACIMTMNLVREAKLDRLASSGS